MAKDYGDRLRTYEKKRDFNRTPEPRGQIEHSRSGHMFVVQKHDASHLHYDFRLEWQGVLKSWAVPKGVSLKPGEKRLAVATEDHPVSYGGFEGTIAEGYGAGTVLLWDCGTWEPLEDEDEGFRKGKLTFRLHGEKLTGTWTLVRMRGKDRSKRDNWLLIHHGDEARSQERPAERSVLTGRSLTEIARGDASLSEARRAHFPTKLSAALATLVDQVPRGNQWHHEGKYDGYRILAAMHEGKLRLMTRNGHDWTARLPTIAKNLAPLRQASVVLDGEVVALAESGRSDFQALQNSFHQGSTASLRYMVFDVIYCNGYDISASPWSERRRLLELIFADFRLADSGICLLSPTAQGHGEKALAKACREGWEGLVCKRGDSPYSFQRTTDWVKVKCHQRQELVVVGFTEPKGKRRHLGALATAYYEGKRLVYAGYVGTGFNEASLATLGETLRALERSTSPLDRTVQDPLRRQTHWVKPTLVIEVEFTGWTDDGILRHPSFKGLREDKDAKSIVREIPRHLSDQPEPLKKARKGRGAKKFRASTDLADAAETTRTVASPPENEHASRNHGKGPRDQLKKTASKPAPVVSKQTSRRKDQQLPLPIALSHPDRVLYPESGVTKQDLAQYLWKVAPLMLPHIGKRPIAVVRCPEGRGKACFFQKHAMPGMPEAIREMSLTLDGKTSSVLVIDDVVGLLSLAQMGCLEVHPWGCLVKTPDKADRLVFDLDPDPGIPLAHVIQAAQWVRKALEKFQLVSFVKTTGGKGFHIVCPLSRRADWDILKSFARRVSSRLVDDHPDLFTIANRKALRKGRIYLDDLRNVPGATSVAPYSTRARPGCPISMPLRWEELAKEVVADAFNIRNVNRRLAAIAKKDPWQGFFDLKQGLPSVRSLGLE